MILDCVSGASARQEFVKRASIEEREGVPNATDMIRIGWPMSMRRPHGCRAACTRHKQSAWRHRPAFHFLIEERRFI